MAANFFWSRLPTLRLIALALLGAAGTGGISAQFSMHVLVLRDDRTAACFKSRLAGPEADPVGPAVMGLAISTNDL
mgnify:CR=1 FL=1